MNLSKFAVKRPVTITMIIMIVLLFGIISLSGLPIDLFPEVELPIAIVMTNYSNAGPQEIESLITNPIEESIATVSNIDEIHSISSEGQSIVMAQFNFRTDMDFASLDMREKIDLIKGFLPEGASNPMVIRIDPNATPILQLSLSNKKGDISGLQALAEEEFQQRFERIEGVASVDIGGGVSQEVQVKVDPDQLTKYGLDINQLGQMISMNNQNMPGGIVDKNSKELTIRIASEFKSLEELKAMPIPLRTGDTIQLEDLAQVELAKKDSSMVSRVNGVDSINISIQKQSDSNTVQVAERVHKEIEKIKSENPDLNMKVILDSSEFIKLSIDNVVKNVLLGSILAVVILFIFLKNIRSTLIIAVSIPLSLIASFILLYFNNITLNMMTLGGLALAVGMLVDSAIVVLENIYRFRFQGLSKEEAAIKGAGQVAMSITASTLTTIAVFLPIVFIEGFVGILFKDFALTVTLSLLASMLVALSFIPMLSSQILELEDEKKEKKKLLYPIYELSTRAFEWIENSYKKLLDWSMNRPGLTLALAGLILVSSLASLFFLGFELLPDSDEGLINIGISMPSGSSKKELDKLAGQIEDKLLDIEEIDTIFTNIGSVNMMNSSGGTASISLNLKSLAERKKSSDQIAEEIRLLTRDIPNADISVRSSNSVNFITGNPVNVKIKGPDLDLLKEISLDVEDMLNSIEGSRNVITNAGEAIPELEVRIDRDKAASYGLTSGQIGSLVRSQVSGSTVSRLKMDGSEVNIVISAEDRLRENADDLAQLSIPSPRGNNLPLDYLAEIELVDGPISIQRENQERVFNVDSQITDRELDQVIADLEKMLDDYNMPPGYYYEIGGENQEMMEAFNQLAKALLVAIALIYMIMAAQFESLLNPFIIMFTIPLAFGGGLLALFISGTTFSATAFIGIIMLAGIIVNNGIVLIDYITTLRSEGYGAKEAIRQAGPVRLRPILMTTLTTILGLVPLALGIGEGAELQAPMAIVVIGGLTLGTLLTLIFIPVVYLVFDNLSVKLKSKGV